jgi:hypothetical protein
MLLDTYNWDYVFGFLGLSSLLAFLVVLTMIEPRQLPSTHDALPTGRFAAGKV